MQTLRRPLTLTAVLLASLAPTLACDTECDSVVLSGIDAYGAAVSATLSKDPGLTIPTQWVLNADACYVRVDCTEANRATFSLSLDTASGTGTQSFTGQTIPLEWGLELDSDTCGPTMEVMVNGAGVEFETYQIWFERQDTGATVTTMVRGILAVGGDLGMQLVIADFDEGVNYYYDPV